jgi:hypothetical protein
MATDVIDGLHLFVKVRLFMEGIVTIKAADIMA